MNFTNCRKKCIGRFSNACTNQKMLSVIFSLIQVSVNRHVFTIVCKTNDSQQLFRSIFTRIIRTRKSRLRSRYKIRVEKWHDKRSKSINDSGR